MRCDIGSGHFESSWKTVLNSLPVTLMSPINLPEGVATSRAGYFKEASLDMTLSILTESAARMSGVERVSIWP